MHFIGEIVIGILTAYLALTNIIASSIESLYKDENISAPTPEEQTKATEHPADLSTLPSEYERGGAIPDILIQNSSYQHAASVAGANTLEDAYYTVTDALVNILCIHENSEYTRTTTGSGFFVSPEGVVLTNAHVAQFLLLETVDNTGETECVIRTGDPATPQYEAELLYISPAWIQKNAHQIADERPRGTGERDYALLYIHAGINNAPLPARFPYVPIATDLLPVNSITTPILVAGYPAEHLFTDGPTATLSPLTASSTITDLFTFDTNYADLMSISGSDLGEHGASGGPVLNENHEVIGLITTKGNDASDGVGSLRALTLSYIDRTIIEESTFDLERTISGNVALRAQLFKETITPFLSRLLESELETEMSR